MNCEKIKEKVKIRMVLESFDLFPVKENRKTAFYFALDRLENTPSLSVDFVKNRAFDYGTGKNFDVISIVQQMTKCSVSEALKYLEKFDFSSTSVLRIEDAECKLKYSIINSSEIRHPALIQYVKSRKVYEQKHLVKEIHYDLRGKKYFGVGFYNNSGGVEIRNKYTKICLGQKDVTLVKSDSNLKNEINIFEGFFDYLTFSNIKTADVEFCDHLILNSTAMLFKIEKRLKEYDKISLFLDNDSNGRSVVEEIQKNYKNVDDCSLFYSEYKDLNEWFCTDKD